MSEKNPAPRKQLEYAGWPNGVDSMSNPLAVLDGRVRWAVNAVNQGGVWTTRPGFKTRATLAPAVTAPRINGQGFTWFTPNSGNPFLVWAITGSVFAAALKPDGSLQEPFQLSGVQFSANAKRVVFCRSVQTQTVINGVAAQPCAARNVLIMQDGGSRACYWDGTTSGSLNPQVYTTTTGGGDTLYPEAYNQTRIGLWMAWSGNRLFVANGTNVYASDIGDPLHFTETLVLTSLPVINFPSKVMGLIDRGTSGTINSQCLVFCQNETYALYSGVQARIPDGTNGYPGWQGTPNFLSKIFAGTGCVAGKSIINHRGLIYWLSSNGLVMFDNINSVTSTQNMPTVNIVEAYANVTQATNQELTCVGAFNNYAFWCYSSGETVSGGTGNRQMQVLDKQPMPQDGAANFAWQGVWTGIAAIEWATLNVYGVNRCYCFSLGDDGVLSVVEAFQANKADNGQPIPWSIETPLHMVSGGIFDRANFLYARMLLQNIFGNLDVFVHWRGTRGVWHEILTTRLTATPGSVLTPYDGTSVPRGTNLPQTRDILTRNLRGNPGECQSSQVEANGNAMDNSDRAFALRFLFTGRASLVAYRIAADNFEQNTEGEVMPAETGFHVKPGAACPFYKDGTVPDYYAPDDNPLGVLTAYPPIPPSGYTADVQYAIPAPIASLDEVLPGLAWKLPCFGNDGGSCATLPYVFQQAAMGGESGKSYRVRLRIAGVSESQAYINGTQGNGWYVGGTVDPTAAYYPDRNTYKLEISDPLQTYFVNPKYDLVLQTWDYENDVTIKANAIVTLSADSGDSRQLPNDGGLTVPDCPEVIQPYDGQFFIMQVKSVVEI